MSTRGYAGRVIGGLRRIVWVAALSLCAGSPVEAMNIGVAVPDVLRVVPDTAAAGQTTALILGVKNYFPARCSLDFGPGTTVLQPVTSLDPTSLRFSLQVAATAPLGRHDIWISCAGLARQKAVSSFLTITPGARLPIGVPDAPPDVTAATPSMLKRGQTYTLTLQASNFKTASHRVTRLEFGAGIQGAWVPDTQPPLWKVAVDPNAPAGRHPITISYLVSSDGSMRTRVATAAVFVEADALQPLPAIVEKKPLEPTPALVPSIIGRVQALDVFAVTPNSWRTGASHEITLSGRQFAAGMHLRFGEGVTAKGEARVVRPTLAYQTVVVAADAPWGERRAEVAAGRGQPFLHATATARISP